MVIGDDIIRVNEMITDCVWKGVFDCRLWSLRPGPIIIGQLVTVDKIISASLSGSLQVALRLTFSTPGFVIVGQPVTADGVISVSLLGFL